MNIEELQNLPDAEKKKLFAARHALTFVESGMNIGLGTGSTASWFVKLLAGKQSQGLKFRACATSSQTTKLAESLNIKIESLDDLGELDLVIDGADEFDPDDNLIKGGGGALLQEKITAQSAKRFIVIADAGKFARIFGKSFLPVEVVQFAWQTTQKRIVQVLTEGVATGDVRVDKISRRMAGDKPFITDEGHYILDLYVDAINKPKELDTALQTIAGVVETGLFLDMADRIVIADCDGSVSSYSAGGDSVESHYKLAELADMLPKD